MSAHLGRHETPAPAARGARSEELRRVADDASRRSLLRLISHELRTPLNSIIGFSEIIARELHGPINEPKYREHAEIVRDAGHRLLKLVNDVMELARLESGLVELDLEPLEPEAILAKVAATLAEEVAKAEVHIKIVPLPGALVTADGRGLKTVLTQILQNAIDHSPKGGLVTLSVRRAGERIVLDVTDEGPGVPIEDLPRILRPFEQAGNTLTRRSEGAGLGLPIAGRLAEAMGGRLRLSCEPGRGLCASVYLPAATDAH